MADDDEFGSEQARVRRGSGTADRLLVAKGFSEVRIDLGVGVLAALGKHGEQEDAHSEREDRQGTRSCARWNHWNRQSIELSAREQHRKNGWIHNERLEKLKSGVSGP